MGAGPVCTKVAVNGDNIWEFYSWAVQCGQRVALMWILLKQYGQSFSVGAAASASSLLRFKRAAALSEPLFIALIIKKITSAVMRKLMMAVMKLP